MQTTTGGDVRFVRPALRPAPFAHLFAVIGIALLVAQRSDYSVGGAVILGIAALPLAVHRVRATLPLIGFVLLGLLSVFWSQLPFATAEAVIRLVLVAAGAAVAAAAFGRREFARLVMFGSGVTVGLSVAMGLAGIASARGSGGLLQGVTSHPNVLAFACVLAALSALASWRVQEDVLWPTLVLLVALAGLAMAQSATAILALGVAVLWALLLRAMRSSPPLQQHAALVSLVAVLATAVALTWRFFDALTELLGRDPTLTGRTIIWRAVLSHVRERPVLGHGLGTAWADNSPTAQEVTRQIGFRAFHAHNGYLDVTLQLGLLGLVLLVATLLVLLRSTTRQTLAEGATAWAPAVVMLLIVYSFAETVVLQYGGWALLAYLAFSTGLVRAPGRSLDSDEHATATGRREPVARRRGAEKGTMAAAGAGGTGSHRAA